MATVYRPLGYTGTTQRLVVNSEMGNSITAYLWGGGGGGGGSDSPGSGGNGQGGGYSQHTFSVSPGDTVDVAVGGAGFGGNFGYTTAGGAAGGSYLISQSWSTRDLVGGDIYAYSLAPYCAFLNTYGVWNGDPYVGIFDHTTTINVAIGGYYTITGSCDNYGYVYIDGGIVMAIPDFHYAVTNTVYLAAGVHSVRIYGVNTGGPGSIGVTIDSNTGSYSGAMGGYEVPWSGAGGGGGGATVVLLNNSVVAVAGGGGGGGGGGHVGNPYGQSAPGPFGTSSSSANGAAGQSNSSDGAGGGGGGGGYRGGNGGAVYGGDQGAYAGTGGSSLGNTTYTASGTGPAYKGAYYPGTIAQGGLGGAAGGRTGGQGTAGYAVIAFDVNGLFVNSGGTWFPVQKAYVKQAGSWLPVKTTYVKQNGVWSPVISSQDRAPVFNTLANTFGVSYRPYGVDY